MESTAPPAFRRLRVYAFDPSASTDLYTATMNDAIVKVAWEELEPGPVGEYIEVVDVDPASDAFYAPVNLNLPDLLAQDGFAPSEGNPQFHQQMVYAIAMTTIRNFERALGRRMLWAPRWKKGPSAYHGREYIPRLRIYPHALREANAYYSPIKRALLFGYFRADGDNTGSNLPGQTVFSCLSHDIIAHEMSHAILDGMHRRYLEPSNPDSLAFHEAFADIVALFQHFTMPEAIRNQIAKLRGDLSQRSLISGLALQFGRAIGNYGALRDGIDKLDPETNLPDAKALASAKEPHTRGSILVSAVFDAFITIYRNRVSDLIRMVTGDGTRFPDRDLHPDLVNRLTTEANKAAGHVLKMCIRALDYLPPVDVTFGDFLRALVTADSDLVVADERGYRLAVVEAFRRRGIFPSECRSLAVDSLLWQQPEKETTINWLGQIMTDYCRTRDDVWRQSMDNAAKFKNCLMDRKQFSDDMLRQMGLSLSDTAAKTIRRNRRTGKPVFEVQSIRTTRRIGPDGDDLPQLVVEITQQRRGFSTKELQTTADKGNGRAPEAAAFTFRGGCTLIIDLYQRRIRYIIGKGIESGTRLDAQRRFLFERDSETLAATYFGDASCDEPFAFLHRNG